MDFLNVLIPTAGLVILDGAVVTPLAWAMSGGAPETARAQAQQQGHSVPGPAGPVAVGASHVAVPKPGGAAVAAKARPIEPPAGAYVGASLIVMGAAGFIAGLAGYPLIGFSTRGRSWPGMLAMIIASFVGFGLSGAKM